jgi:hypothetical protein
LTVAGLEAKYLETKKLRLVRFDKIDSNLLVHRMLDLDSLVVILGAVCGRCHLEMVVESR